MRILETCDKKDKVLKIFIKNGWNDKNRSFDKLNFHNLRNKFIPEILSLYGDVNTVIKSCYTNEISCNSFIHISVNIYDLQLLNTFPNWVPMLVLKASGSDSFLLYKLIIILYTYF